MLVISYSRGRQTFCKEPDSKYFRICGPYSLCNNYSALPFKHKSSHRQYIHMGMALLPKQILFTKRGSAPDFAYGLQVVCQTPP